MVEHWINFCSQRLTRWGRYVALGLVCFSLLWAAPAFAAAELAHTTKATPRLQSPISRQTGYDASENDPQLMMPPDIERILNRGKLVVAVLGSDNAPFFMALSDGSTGGLDIQLAWALANELGVDLELNRSAKTFNDVVDTVFHQEADIAISKISRTMKRSVRVRFSHPYVEMRQGLLINRLLLAQQTRSDNVVETIRALTGEVGVIKGSSYVGFLKQKFPKASIVELDTWGDIVNAVSTGEILAGYRDELEIKKVVLTKPDAALQLKTAVLTDTKDALAMVLPWNSTHLLAFVNQYLDTLDSDYTVDSILEKFAAYWDTQKQA